MGGYAGVGLMINPMKYVGPLARKLLIPGLVSLMSLLSVCSLSAQAVLTWHNDTVRSGQNLAETLLTPSSVNSSNFGLIYNLPLDGKVDAQPLYVPAVSISGTLHNILYVVTENDSVYAFDADSGSQLWFQSMLQSGETASPPPSGCTNITPTIGITSTPAIDMSIGPNGTIYLVALSTDGTNYFQRLHALDLTTGIDQTGWPIVITATYPGNSSNGDGSVLTFDPSLYTERAALLISNGVVYTTWASHCDVGSYNSWVIGYNESTQAQSVINLTPDGYEGGIWMSGAGPAADASGNIYLLVGNGTFDTTLTGNFPSGGDYGNSFMSLSTTSGLAVQDYFTMDNTVSESNSDEDLGSGGALLLPSLNDANGNPHQLAVGAGKDGNAYVVDRANMGEFNMSSNAVYQVIPLGNPVFSTPAWFNNTLYFGPVGSPLAAYQFSGGSFSLSPAFSTSQSFGGNCPNTGATPSISANGSSNGIVWVLDTPCDNSQAHLPAVLHAFDAGTLNELYNSTQNTSENFGAGTTFPTSTVANGKVFVATTAGVSAFGLCTFGSDSSVNVDATAHAGGVNVITSSGACSWSASTASDFITITAGQTGTGNGTVIYSVPANSGAQRTGTIVITGQTFTKTYTITQAAPSSLVPPSNPVPISGTPGVSLTPTLSWTGSAGATSYDVYFGTSQSPTLVTNTTSTSYAPGTLSPGVTYYWGVLAKNSGGSNGSPIWSFTTVNTTSISVTPSSGTGLSQTFTMQYSDSAGAASLSQVWAYFNTTLASPATSACMFYYSPANNQIDLLNDNATVFTTATLGTATTLQNSQCSLNVGTALASRNGNTLTLNVAVTFKPAFAGSKNVYLHAVGVSGTNSAWQQLGSWTVASTVGTASTVSVTPSSGSGATQTFNLQYSDTAGASSLTQVWAYFNATLASPATNACMFYYSAANNQINLLSDSGTAFTPATRGAATTLQNSQCSLNVATATVVPSGNRITLNVTVTFKPSFAGAKNVYLHAVDVSGSNSGWQQLGTWTVTSGPGTPSTVSVTPNSGSGASQTFNLQYSDTAGASSLTQVWAYFNATLASPATNACLLYYNTANNQINLLSDNGTVFTPATLGAATTLQNSQCSLNVATATLAPSGNTLTLNVTVAFKPAFDGPKNVYLHAVDVSGSNSGWQQLGAWTVTSGPGTPSTVSVTPNSGSGFTQTFNLQYSDTAGASSLTQVWAYFNATLASPAVSACMLYYNTANNQINLLNDSGTVFMPAALGTATTLQNSQCSLNLATATVASSGSTLTLSVTVTFQAAFAGAKNVYLHAVDVSGSNSGWQQLGGWTIP
jgi:hypothetical protein